MICRETNLDECLETLERLNYLKDTERYRDSECYKKVLDISFEAHKRLAKKFIDEMYKH